MSASGTSDERKLGTARAGGVTPWGILLVVVGAALSIGVPAGSFAVCQGCLSWRMFSSSASYRLDIVADARDGATRDIDPRELSPYVGASVATFLPGAGQWRFDPVAPSLRAELPRLGFFACRVGAFDEVRVAFSTRPDLDASPTTETLRVRCPR